MADPMHTVSDVARHWRHPDILALRARVRSTDCHDTAAYKAALNAIRDRIQELKSQ